MKNTKLLIACRFTLEQVENLRDKGQIGKGTYRQYMFLWTWSACRHSGNPGRVQDRFYNRFGSEAFWRRIERVKKIVESLQTY